MKPPIEFRSKKTAKSSIVAITKSDHAKVHRREITLSEAVARLAELEAKEQKRREQVRLAVRRYRAKQNRKKK